MEDDSSSQQQIPNDQKVAEQDDSEQNPPAQEQSDQSDDSDSIQKIDEENGKNETKQKSDESKNKGKILHIHQTLITVSLSRIWFIDEMNPGNGYYSSPDPYLGKQMAPKIEKSTEPFWRKLRLKYEIQLFENLVLKYMYLLMSF